VVGLEELQEFGLIVVFDRCGEDGSAAVPTHEPCTIADDEHEEGVRSVLRTQLHGDVCPDLTDEKPSIVGILDKTTLPLGLSVVAEIAERIVFWTIFEYDEELGHSGIGPSNIFVCFAVYSAIRVD